VNATSVIPTSTRERAILHHPDQTSTWSVVVAGVMTTRVDAGVIRARLGELADAVPAVRARLLDDNWVPGDVPDVVLVDSDPLASPLMSARYSLATEPPVRVVLERSGERVAVAGHHAAFDGLGLVALLAGLAGEPLPTPEAGAPIAPSFVPGRFDGRRLISGLAHPADRVAPSPVEPIAECFVSRDVDLSGPHVTARLADACVRAVAARNGELGSPWARVALSIGVGGQGGVGNQASYRRVELGPGTDVVAAVTAAIEDPTEPSELRHAPKSARWLRPLASRLSDSLLISNVGRHPIAGVQRLLFFPVARGRSAVAIGAAGVAAGRATVTLRARYLSEADGEQLLADAVSML